MPHKPQAERPWSVPVSIDEVPETARHFDLVADERVRAAVAKLAGLRSLPRLTASFDVTRRGRDGLRVVGQVSATVGQTCVVTLDPMESEIDEPIDVVFTPEAAWAPDEEAADHKRQVEVSEEDAPEPLVNGTVDLGALATEFLILGVDPYPRKADAVFDPPETDDIAGHPFAELRALRKRGGGQ